MASVLILLQVTASPSSAEKRDLAGWGRTDPTLAVPSIGKPPAYPSSLSRSSQHAQKLWLLQVLLRAAVPFVKQSLLWSKKCPCLALAPHHSAVHEAGHSGTASASSGRLSPHCSPVAGMHWQWVYFRQQPLLWQLAGEDKKKTTPKQNIARIWVFFQREKYFECPFPSLTFPQAFHAPAE